MSANFKFGYETRDLMEPNKLLPHADPKLKESGLV